MWDPVTLPPPPPTSPKQSEPLCLGKNRFLIGEKQVSPPTYLSPFPAAGCQELVNIWCSLVTLNAHLRQRGQLPPDGEEPGSGLQQG